MTTVHPTLIAGIKCHVAMSNGQFQGVMEPTPTSKFAPGPLCDLPCSRVRSVDNSDW